MKIEMHAHTKEVSPCAWVSAEDTVKAYKQAGYDKIVITNHFNWYVLDAANTDDTVKRVDHYLSGYRLAKQAGDACGLEVIFGVEVALRNCGPEDYLIYGVTEKMLYDNPYLYDLTLQELRNICDNYGALLFQAHPFREYLKPADPALLDGVEVFNGNPRHNSHNDIAAEWAIKHGLLISSGSDFHQSEDISRGGIITNLQASLVEILKSKNYQIITV